MPLRPDMPEPQFVMAADGTALATYSWGELDAPTVLVTHGFASSIRDNWSDTAWIRDLVAADFRVVAADLRGHGASEKPHEPAQYSLDIFVADLLSVIDTYLLDEMAFLGYSLGGRIGWQLMTTAPHHITHAVLGGIPDGKPLRKLNVAQAREYVATGAPIQDALTRSYITLAERLKHNDTNALLALADGMRHVEEDDPGAHPPLQPTLVATGSDDPILRDSQALEQALPNGTFFTIPGRGHINAPVSRDFRSRGIAYLRAPGA